MDLFKQAFSEWSKDRASMLAAATAYYILMSLTPLLILAIVSLGYILGRQAVQSYLLNYAQSLGGPTVGSAIVAILQQVSNPAYSYSATIFGLVFLILGAAGAFIQTRRAFDIIWDVKKGHGPAIERTITYYVLSFLLMLVLGILIFIAVMATAVVLPAVQALNIPLPLNMSWIQTINFIGSIVLITLLLMVVYRFLIDVTLGWRDVFTGSIVTAILFVIGNLLLEFYISFSHMGSVYGAAGTLFIFIIWLYYSSQIFFYGAEFIKADAMRRRPHKHAGGHG
ncbi:MAG TPA: YihY/virulence factor BrkB family protein [Methanotrichaceae archaeon]|nr:YihY/virulence factor BrkB family protein [Methanotrichaceae archaeon]